MLLVWWIHYYSTMWLTDLNSASILHNKTNQPLQPSIQDTTLETDKQQHKVLERKISACIKQAHPAFGPEIWIASSNWIQSHALKLLLGLEEVIRIDNRGVTQSLIAVFGMNHSKTC